MNGQYQFFLPIGDWSDDGHGKCEKFLVTSNMPIEQVREAHYRIQETTGINIEEVCSEYQEDTLPAETVKTLCDLGFTFPDGEHTGETKVFTDDMVRIWIFLLQKSCPGLSLEVTPEPEMLPFYGFDNKHRHIRPVGYGLFD